MGVLHQHAFMLGCNFLSEVVCFCWKHGNMLDLTVSALDVKYLWKHVRKLG
jgi:hypothetical protein